MKPNNLAGYSNITQYVKAKLENYSRYEKSFANLFEFMFSEKDNVMAEMTDGFRIKQVTYGQSKDNILALRPVLASALRDIPAGSMVGLYMDNSVKWIEVFWCILSCGYKPLLMNSRMSKEVLEDILSTYSVNAVISDGEPFSVNTVLADSLYASVGQSYPVPETLWGDEVIFMSSGTTSAPKLCAYPGENFYYQIADSYNILINCPQIGRHYNGQIKHLALLPFYHVFGFIAVYLWFGFFSRTFVFLKDLHPQTLLSTVRKHNVTHIFAVPLVWETVYKEAMRKISAKGEKTAKKFSKASAFVNSCDALGDLFAKRAFKEVRDNLFGDSICFLISGGSGIPTEVLSFFNGIGYHIANGYGMTEIGITSVDISTSKKKLNQGTIGNPFSYTNYDISQNGELLVRGNARASRIMQNGNETVLMPDDWFNTNDLATTLDARYLLHGRKDDLIICSNGENLNPEITERQLHINDVDELCIFKGEQGEPILLISSKKVFTKEKLTSLKASAFNALEAAGVRDVITAVKITSDRLIQGTDFKISRQKIARLYSQGKFNILDPDSSTNGEQMLEALAVRIRAAFADALMTDPDRISDDADFFTDLGGSSLDYFTLIDILKEELGVALSELQQSNLTSVRAFYEYLKK